MIEMLTNLDFVELERLDFTPDCESNLHFEYGAGDVVAVIHTKAICCGGTASGFTCVGCLNFHLTNLGRWFCDPALNGCGGRFKPYKDCVDRVEYL